MRKIFFIQKREKKKKGMDKTKKEQEWYNIVFIIDVETPELMDILRRHLKVG